jgi:hypothetical protein
MRMSSTATTSVTLLVDLATIIPVLPGKLYSAKVSYRADGTARQCRVLIEWFRNNSSLISTSAGGFLTSFTTQYREMSVSGVAPDEATRCRIVLSIEGVAVQNEGHFVDRVQFAEGDTTVPWVDPAVSGLVLTGSGVRFS